MSATGDLHRRLVKNCRIAWRELRNDVSETGRLGLLAWLCFCIWALGLVVVLVLLAILSSPKAPIKHQPTACMPDGTFNMRLKDEFYGAHYWNSDSFFQITLGFGVMTFTKAKIIDVAWDVVIGRGGQALLAWVTWRVFARYVALCMEVAPITFQSFKTIFLQKDATMISIYRLASDFVKRSLPSKKAMVFMVTTLIFILFFPTFASAMTGYSSIVSDFVADVDGNYVPLDKFRQAAYVIHDGWRINKTGNYYIFDYDNNNEWDSQGLVTYPSYCGEVQRNGTMTNVRSCDVHAAIDNYIFFFYELNMTNQKGETIFNNTVIPAPRLDMMGFPSYSAIYPGHGIPDSKFAAYPRHTWVYGNHTYNQTYFETKGSCQPTQDYKWGFSFIQLFIMVTLLFVLTVGMWILHLSTNHALRQREHTPVAGEFKGVLELADAVHHDFKGLSTDARVLPESHIRRRIHNDLKGGSIAYQAPPLHQEQQNSSGQEKIWVFSTFVVTALWSTIWLVNFVVCMALIGPMLGCVLATSIGTTARSRTLILFFSCLLGIMIGGILYQAGPEWLSEYAVYPWKMLSGQDWVD